jgi:hypothetical protein
MAAPINGVDDKGAALLEQAMNESFKTHGANTTITHIAKYLGNLDDLQAKDLCQKRSIPIRNRGLMGNISTDEPTSIWTILWSSLNWKS